MMSDGDLERLLRKAIEDYRVWWQSIDDLPYNLCRQSSHRSLTVVCTKVVTIGRSYQAGVARNRRGHRDAETPVAKVFIEEAERIEAALTKLGSAPLSRARPSAWPLVYDPDAPEWRRLVSNQCKETPTRPGEGSNAKPISRIIPSANPPGLAPQCSAVSREGARRPDCLRRLQITSEYQARGRGCVAERPVCRSAAHADRAR